MFALLGIDRVTRKTKKKKGELLVFFQFDPVLKSAVVSLLNFIKGFSFSYKSHLLPCFLCYSKFLMLFLIHMNEIDLSTIHGLYCCYSISISCSNLSFFLLPSICIYIRYASFNIIEEDCSVEYFRATWSNNVHSIYLITSL